MRVQVYFNLHKRLFSVVDMSTGRVVEHTDQIVIDSPAFVVQKAGHERAVRERRRNVHAYVRGAPRSDGV